MAGNKLVHFYFKKLGNWNLMYSFMKGFWVSYLSICFFLIIAVWLSFMYGSLLLAWTVFTASICLVGILFYIMIVRKARRYIKLNYQIRNFNEWSKLKQYLLYAYLKQNGFKTREDLDKLIGFIRSEYGHFEENKKRNLLGMIMSVFIAVFLAIFGGSFLIQVEDFKNRTIFTLIILFLAVLLRYLGKMMEQFFRHFTKKEARQSFQLIQQIILIQMILLTSENTEYHPFLAIEKKVQENPFLQEIILSKSFL